MSVTNIRTLKKKECWKPLKLIVEETFLDLGIYTSGTTKS